MIIFISFYFIFHILTKKSIRQFRRYPIFIGNYYIRNIQLIIRKSNFTQNVRQKLSIRRKFKFAYNILCTVRKWRRSSTKFGSFTHPLYTLLFWNLPRLAGSFVGNSIHLGKFNNIVNWLIINLKGKNIICIYL